MDSISWLKRHLLRSKQGKVWRRIRAELLGPADDRRVAKSVALEENQVAAFRDRIRRRLNRQISRNLEGENKKGGDTEGG